MTQRLTLSQMAERLHISTKTLRREVKAKAIPFYLVGKRMRFDPFEVEAYFRITEKEPESNVVFLPVSKRKGKVITSKRFAEAV